MTHCKVEKNLSWTEWVSRVKIENIHTNNCKKRHMSLKNPLLKQLYRVKHNVTIFVITAKTKIIIQVDVFVEALARRHLYMSYRVAWFATKFRNSDSTSCPSKYVMASSNGYSQPCLHSHLQPPVSKPLPKIGTHYNTNIYTQKSQNVTKILRLTKTNIKDEMYLRKKSLHHTCWFP